MSNYNDEILSHYGITKTAGRVPKMEDGGSLNEAIRAKLWRCLRVGLSNAGSLTPASQSAVPEKWGRLGCMADVQGRSESGEFLSVTVTIDTTSATSGEYTVEISAFKGGSKDKRSFGFHEPLSSVAKEIGYAINRGLSKL